MAVTVEPHATGAGLKVIESGGNAVDAAVTADKA
jgi:gamma-glutamyltranspeptidase